MAFDVVAGLRRDAATRSIRGDHTLVKVRCGVAPDEVNRTLDIGVGDELCALIGQEGVLEAMERTSVCCDVLAIPICGQSSRIGYWTICVA